MYGLFNDSFQPAVDGVGTVVYNNAIQMYRMGRDVHVVVPYSKGEPELPEPFPVTRIPSVPVPPRPPYSVGCPSSPPVRLARCITCPLISSTVTPPSPLGGWVG